MLKFVLGAPALLADDGRNPTLIVSDLHLGFEKSLAERGLILPTQTFRLLERLKLLVVQNDVRRVIVLGDVKHGTSKILLHEWSDVSSFFTKLLEIVDRVEIVPGNHDGGIEPLLPRGVRLHSVKGYAMSLRERTIFLMHGHTWPAVEGFAAKELVMGHHHFVFEARDSSGLRMREPVWVIARWNPAKVATSYLAAGNKKTKGDPIQAFRSIYSVMVGSPQIIVLPTFNPMLAGTPINSPSHQEHIGPLFRSKAIDLPNAELHLLDGTYLGRLSSLASR